MSAIAAQLGGSKTTLWSYFPNKRDLFMAVADALIGQYVDSIIEVLQPGSGLDAALNKLGERLLKALMSEPIVALMRIVTGEAGRFPELGDLFHQRGLGYGWNILKEFLDGELERGQIRAGVDTLRAAQHFIALCQSASYQRFMLGGAPRPDDHEIVADVAAATHMFVAAYC